MVQIHCEISEPVLPIVLFGVFVRLPEELILRCVLQSVSEAFRPLATKSCYFSSIAFFWINFSNTFMFTSVAPACSQELNGHKLAWWTVCDGHGANVLNIHRSDQQIIHSGVRSWNQKVLICWLKEDMLLPDRFCCQYPSPWDSHCCISVHVVPVVIVLRNAGRNWRVMADLLSEVFIVLADEFKGFT